MLVNTNKEALYIYFIYLVCLLCQVCRTRVIRAFQPDTVNFLLCQKRVNCVGPLIYKEFFGNV